MTYLSQNSLESTASSAKPLEQKVNEAVQQGVQQGINKLKGLFGK